MLVSFIPHFLCFEVFVVRVSLTSVPPAFEKLFTMRDLEKPRLPMKVFMSLIYRSSS